MNARVIPITPIRASSLSEMFDCPARWAAKYLFGMRGPCSGAAQLGTAVHAGTAAYDASRLGGATPISADDAAGALVDAIHNPDYDVDWDGTNPNDAERIALALHTRYCAEIAPRQRYVAVELLCESLEITELGIVLTGSTDRVRETSMGHGIADLKTGARAVGADGLVTTQGHAAQLGVYELLAQHSMGLSITAPAQIIGLNTGKMVMAQRVGIGEVSGAKELLLGTDEQPGLLQYASNMLRSGDFYGNSKSMLCSPKYCPAHATCRFKS